MTDILGQLAPIFVYFAIGLLLRKTGVADKSHGEFLLRLVFFVTLPLLILTSLSATPLTPDKAMLPVANVLVNLACMFCALTAARLGGLPRNTTGTLLVNTMIVNNAFMFPFILAVYGEQGFSDAILFDFGNAIMMATITYAVAFRYSEESHGKWTMLLKILKSPLVWALALGVTLSLTGIGLPEPVLNVATPLGSMTGPLIILSLGLFFSLDIGNPGLVSLAVFIRMGLGLAFGVALATLFGLQDTTFVVVSLCAAAPIGFNALTLSSLARLDTALSSGMVSLSMLAGLIYIPLLILLFGG